MNPVEWDGHGGKPVDPYWLAEQLAVDISPAGILRAAIEQLEDAVPCRRCDALLQLVVRPNGYAAASVIHTDDCAA